MLFEIRKDAPGPHSGRGIYDDLVNRERAGLRGGWPPPGRGLPIGCATSQLFAAHVYLAALDHFVKRELCVPGYVRYVDDLFLFGDRRADLRHWRAEVARWLSEEHHLRLKHPEARVLACEGHLDALGYRLRRSGLTARPRLLRRLARPAADCARHGEPGAFARSAAVSAGAVLFG